ncbi:Ferredoxin [Candidatus Hydrogenisulfobacillus filiaventi]|uniref:Ferredoxin n=1 Tax=Candidatus Hydrogenisulfobacillus filiaventi TaxID=2707344 RepID=A0A6F8ZHS5_9FIRM|nr:Ferredoxin [Candidatus Hydrogenisulfobacillus filiaventi]
MAFQRVGLSTRLFDRRPAVVTWVQGRPVLVARVEGQLYAIEAVCAHMGCVLLTETDGYRAVCPAHGAAYDLRTGALLQPAAVHPERSCGESNLSLPLPTYPARDVDGFLEVDLGG